MNIRVFLQIIITNLSITCCLCTCLKCALRPHCYIFLPISFPDSLWHHIELLVMQLKMITSLQTVMLLIGWEAVRRECVELWINTRATCLPHSSAVPVHAKVTEIKTISVQLVNSTFDLCSPHCPQARKLPIGSGEVREEQRLVQGIHVDVSETLLIIGQHMV